MKTIRLRLLRTAAKERVKIRRGYHSYDVQRGFGTIRYVYWQTLKMCQTEEEAIKVLHEERRKLILQMVKDTRIERENKRLAKL